jgi:hypothetical protein
VRLGADGFGKLRSSSQLPVTSCQYQPLAISRTCRPCFREARPRPRRKCLLLRDLGGIPMGLYATPLLLLWVKQGSSRPSAAAAFLAALLARIVIHALRAAPDRFSCASTSGARATPDRVGAGMAMGSATGLGTLVGAWLRSVRSDPLCPIAPFGEAVPAVVVGRSRFLIRVQSRCAMARFLSSGTSP